MSVNHRSYNTTPRYYTSAIGDAEIGTLGHLLGGSKKLYDAWIPDGTTHIKDGCFDGCYVSTYSTRIPNSIKTIGNRAFYMCYRYNLTFPTTMESIGDYAFCANPESIGTLDIGARSIGEYAFAYGHLDKLTIRKTVESIGKNCFIGSYITSLIIEDGVTTLDDYAFNGPYFIDNLQLPKTLKSVGNYCFNTQGTLGETNTTITVPKSVTSLGVSAFGGYSLGTFEFEEGFSCQLVAGTFTHTTNFNILKLPSTIKLSQYCFNGLSANKLYINLPKDSLNISATGLFCNNIIWTG